MKDKPSDHQRLPMPTPVPMVVQIDDRGEAEEEIRDILYRDGQLRIALQGDGWEILLTAYDES